MKLIRAAFVAVLALLAFTAQAAEFRQISQILSSSGKPVVNGYIYIGTYGLDPVSNPISLYSDSALSVPIANPVRTDSYGRPTTDIYFSQSQYSYTLKTSAGVTIEGPKNRDAIPTQASVAASQAATATSCGTFGGTADVLTCTLSPAITAYTDLMTVRGRLAGDNTGAVTLSVNGVGAKNVVKWDGTALAAGDLQQNDTATFAFDSTNNRWQLQSPNATVTIAGASTISGDKTFSGANTHSGTLTLTGALLGANPIILEGATADAFETTVALTDPTADRTATIPDATGTLVMDSAGFSGATGLYGLGGLYKIQSQTASASAQLDFSIPSGFTQVVFVLKNIAPATDDTELAIRFSSDGGSTFVATGSYRNASAMFNTAGTQVGVFGAAVSSITLAGTGANAGMGNAAGETSSGELWITGLNESARPNVHGTLAYHGSAVNDYVGCNIAGSIDTAATYNAVRFLMMSGNIASGTITMYGIK